MAYHDSCVPVLDEDYLHLCSVELTEQVLQSKDCVVIVTPHSGVEWQWVVKNSLLVVDTRNATKGAKDTEWVVKLEC